MDRYPLTLRWTGSTATRTYSRDATAGAPGKPDLALTAGDPALGDITRWNPEDILGASLSMCHMLTFLSLCSKVGVDVRSYDDDAAALTSTVDKITRVSKIRLAPTIRLAPGASVEKAESMFEKAHKYCIIANSISAEVEMAPTFLVD